MVDLSKNKIIAFVRLARPVHWIKNLGIFAALVITGELLEKQQFIVVFLSFWAFNFVTSATYVLNDIFDAERDKKHPRKRHRPIAAGIISKGEGLIFSALLTATGLVLAEEISHLLFLLLTGYLLMQIAYSMHLKHLHIFDILIIAAGFVIRVYSGAFVINAHLSVWFLLCVISVALFLASGKRRAEMGSLGKNTSTRPTLKKYSKELLNSYVTMFGNAAWMSWALFTFFESPRVKTPVWIFLSEISKTASVNKLLMITIPVTIFGIMRYQSLIFEDRSEAPEKILLTDRELIGSILVWSALVIWILYGGITYSE